MKKESDPRVFFAAERTLLAWLRTGIASIGLGFLIARFGYFLTMFNGRTSVPHHLATLIGIGLAALGTAMIAAATWQHGRFVNALQPSEFPQRYSARLSLVLSTLMVVFGLALILYLALASGSTAQTHPPGPTSGSVSSGDSSSSAR